MCLVDVASDSKQRALKTTGPPVGYATATCRVSTVNPFLPKLCLITGDENLFYFSPDYLVWKGGEQNHKLLLLSAEYQSRVRVLHYGDVIKGAIASQITSLTIVFSTV